MSARKSERLINLLIALLNALLSLSGDRAIAAVTFLREEERPRVEELKFSVVYVKCRDGRGTVFVVESPGDLTHEYRRGKWFGNEGELSKSPASCN